ncbi:hypothetical protein [Endozoicomonas acroporae]|uniref:hypothetical protein n=1 Tax=Endozoicomonas acroporae TaxID=1701104 RepID=UPI0013D64EE9|nr:hypothetical protein [Endozoicomonas acroporae]
MIPLIALITGSAKSLLTGKLSPIDSINQLDMSPSDIASAKQQLPIYPIPSPAALYFSASCITHDSPPINSKELNDYQIVELDENAIPGSLSWSEIDTQDTGSISSTATDMSAVVTPDTSISIEQTSGLHDNYSMIKNSPPSDPWPQGILSKDDHINYGDLRDWLNDLNGMYDEEPVFRSIFNLPYPSDQSQLFPDQISTHPTYGWVFDNFLTDWINDRVMQVITPDPGEFMDESPVIDNNQSQQTEASKTFDQIYIPFIEKFDHQDEEQAKEFFQKIYELLAPLRGLLVITIAGIDRGNGNIAKGQRLSRLLNQSGVPASNIRVIESHRHSYVLAKRGENRDHFESSPKPYSKSTC